MTTPDQILVDLLAGQATSDALSERVRVPMLVVKALCQKHERDGLLSHELIAGTLTVWRLTTDGATVARSLQSTRGHKAGTANAAR